jgi:hypothetical protein
MLREKTVISIGVSLIIFFIYSIFSFANAAGNIHVGNIEIHPFATVEQKYDDNIFLQPKHQNKKDWITITTLGLALDMPIMPDRKEDSYLKVKYSADIINFWDYTKQSRVDHNAKAVLNHKFPNDFTLKIEDNFQKTADPPNSELTALERRFRNNTQAVLGYMREKIGFDLGYNNIRDAYVNLKDLDKYAHIFTATGYYQLFPKTLMLAEYNLGKIVYDTNTTNSDSKYYQWRVGLKGQIAPKLIGVVKVGYKQTDYKESGKNNFKGFATFINVTYDLKERTTLNIFGERSSEESTYSTNSYFEYDRLGLAVEHELLERLFLVSSAYCQLDRYPDVNTEGSLTAERKDVIYDGSIGLRYEIKDWVNLETNYEYKQRDSKFSTYDYKDNRYTVKINFMF